MSEEELKLLAEEAAQFLKTDYGKRMLDKFAELYNDLHHEAEQAVLIEVKAMKVERAAGLRMAMDYLTREAALFESGYFDKKEKPPEQE